MEQVNDQEVACLRALARSDYEVGKNINPLRVAGTCQWVLQNSKFIKWTKDQTGMIWVTADPGAGKSVLCRALADDGNLATSYSNGSTTCYFFFKDGFNEGNWVTGALSALLHQLFVRKRALINYALPDFRNLGYQISLNFKVLWKILCTAAADPRQARSSAFWMPWMNVTVLEGTSSSTRW
jgi:hypothetical protein